MTQAPETGHRRAPVATLQRDEGADVTGDTVTLTSQVSLRGRVFGAAAFGATEPLEFFGSGMVTLSFSAFTNRNGIRAWRFDSAVYTFDSSFGIELAAPNGGETLYQETAYPLQWVAQGGAGGIQRIDVSTSGDGGSTWEPVPECTGLAGVAHSCLWRAPGPPSVARLISVAATDALGRAATDASNDGFGIVAGRCTSRISNDAVAVSVTHTLFSPAPVPNSPAGTFVIDADVSNASSRILDGPVNFVVRTLTGGNQLISATEGAGGVGSKQAVTPTLRQGTTTQVRLVIGLATRQPFEFFVDLEACAP